MRNQSSRSLYIWNCVSCGGPRTTEKLCSYCGNYYPKTNIKKKEETKGKSNSIAKSSSSRLRPIDRKYTVSRFNKGVEISWDWKTGELIFIIPFTLFWNGVMFSMIGGGGFNPLMSLHIGVGIYLISLSTVLCVNSTLIRATRQKLQIRHHPIPWGKDYCFSAKEVGQLLVSTGTRSDKHNTWEVPILELVTITGTSYELLKGKSGKEFTDYEHIRLTILEAIKPTPMRVYEDVNW